MGDFDAAGGICLFDSERLRSDVVVSVRQRTDATATIAQTDIEAKVLVFL